MEQLDLRKRLWNSAYDGLIAKEPDLVNTYERILSLQFSGTDLGLASLTSQTDDVEQNNQEKRLLQLRYIAEAAFTRIQTKMSVEQGIKKRNGTLSLISEIIDKALKAVGEVATPWVGFGLALEILLSSITTKEVNRQGLICITSRMDYYWNLSVLFLNENRTHPFTPENRNYSEKRLIELYMKILSWQMETICSYSRHSEVLFLQNLPRIRDWDGKVTSIEQAKDKMLSSVLYAGTKQIHYYLNGLSNTAMSNEIKLGNLHSENLPLVCTACGNLDTNVWGARSHSTYIIDIRHASSECPACEVLISGLSEIEKPLDERAQLTLSVRRGSSLKVAYHWGDLSVEGARNLEFYTKEGFPKPWPAVGNSRALQMATTSRRIQLVSEWFRQCLTEHRICKVRKQNLPTRVLYVGNENREPHVYETHNEEVQYTALSHCWGEMQDIHLLTTREVLEDRKQSISMAILPQTFIDAVLLTRSLGIEYIWIDSLCIIQDDEEDWARESARMAEVYQNAALTISADGAANGSKGLFETSMKNSVEEIPIQPKHTANSSLVYVRETTLDTGGDHVHVISHKESAPLRHRGWALQEWLLSTRIVHFTMGEILWECNDIQLCECQVISQSPTKWKDQDQNSRKVSRPAYYREGDRDRNRGYLDWSQVVAEFSKRQLTKEMDRLPALSGLAAFTKANAEADYIAGLWKSELPEALMWEVEGDESRRHDRYCAPTWSWASIHGHVSFPPPNSKNEFPLKCKILEFSRTLATENPFGALVSGSIKIKGAIGTLSKNMKRMGGALELEGKGDDFEYWGELVVDVKGLAFEVTSADEIPFLIVRREIVNLDIIYGVALKPFEKGNGTFTRVGNVRITYEGSHWESWILNTLKVSEQIITIL